MSMSHNHKSTHREQRLNQKRLCSQGAGSTRGPARVHDSIQRDARYHYRLRCRKRLLCSLGTDGTLVTLKDTHPGLVDKGKGAKEFQRRYPPGGQNGTGHNYKRFIPIPHRFLSSSKRPHEEPPPQDAKLQRTKEKVSKPTGERRQPFRPELPSSLRICANSPADTATEPLSILNQPVVEHPPNQQNGARSSPRSHSGALPSPTEVDICAQEKFGEQKGSQSPPGILPLHQAISCCDLEKLLTEFGRRGTKYKVQHVSKETGRCYWYTAQAVLSPPGAVETSGDGRPQITRISRAQVVKRLWDRNSHALEEHGANHGYWSVPLELEQEHDSFRGNFSQLRDRALRKCLYKCKSRYYTGVSVLRGRRRRTTTVVKNFFYYLRSCFSVEWLPVITFALTVDPKDTGDLGTEIEVAYSPVLLFPGAWPEVVVHKLKRVCTKPPPTSRGPHFPGAWPEVSELDEFVL